MGSWEERGLLDPAGSEFGCVSYQVYNLGQVTGPEL